MPSSAPGQKHTAGTRSNSSTGAGVPRATSQLDQQIMRRMVLNASCVISGALLGVCRGNQVCILDQRQSMTSGIVQPIFNDIRPVVTLKMMRMIGVCHIVLEMKGISELGRSCRSCRTGIIGSVVVAASIPVRP